MSGLTTSGQLIDALLRDGVLASADCTPTVIETHISWVILAGEFAYKIKKPVNLGFVDFSSLEARRRACLEELRLNRRLTPELYLDVQVIHGNVDEPTLESRGPILEYAVKMKRFPPDSLVAGAPADRLTRREIDDLAALVAEFHRGLPRSTSGQPWGLPDQIWAPAADSLDQLGGLLSDDDGKRSLNRVRAFLEEQFHRNRQVMERRHAEGAVRECHGDLHLGNLVRIGGRIVPFDALEFNPALRWIDVMNEVAFLVMDLDTHGRQDLAFRFLNRYLDASGDHDGLRVLPFYLGYRALVRAKVRAMSPPGLAGGARPAVDNLLTYAGDPQSGRKPVLVLMSGLSGSGKSWLAAQLAESLPAIHVRSDVERKRLFALGALEQTGGCPRCRHLYARRFGADVSPFARDCRRDSWRRISSHRRCYESAPRPPSSVPGRGTRGGMSSGDRGLPGGPGDHRVASPAATGGRQGSFGGTHGDRRAAATGI